ncbi:MAG: hypothetical protein IKO36_02810 [Bacteroidaceae bacterium]|nr:hypothetical protein [Bacteroidaceae bacterium]
MKILYYNEFLFEGEYENFNERKKELISYLKGKNYKNYIQTLNDMLKDPKLKALIEDGFGGELGDIKLKFSEKYICIDELYPTQNEIGLTQSLDWGLKSTKNFVKYFEPVVEIKHPLVTLNGKYVIDGHHRWSEILCFNPKAKVVCLDYAGNITPLEMLKITQGAIAATRGNIKSNEKHGTNIYDMKKIDIKKYVEQTIVDDVVLAFKTRDNGTFVDKQDVVNYITNNAVSMIKKHPLLNNAPNRGLMPQTSDGDNIKMSEPLKNMRDNKMTDVPEK